MAQGYAPELTFNIGVQYDFALPNGATLSPRIDYAHIGEAWTSIFNNEALGDRLEARNLVNLLLSYKTDDWTLAAYALNATDQTYIAEINAGLRYAGPPSPYGVTLTRRRSLSCSMALERRAALTFLIEIGVLFSTGSARYLSSGSGDEPAVC